MEPAQDEYWMEEALREAACGEAAGEVPVGAIVLCDGVIQGRGHNRAIADCDPSAHAEIVALRSAAWHLKNYRLENCEMFVTIEPCAMCAGALMHARIRRLVYGAADVKAGGVTSLVAVLNHPGLNHTMEVVSGVLAETCAGKMQAFFQKKRRPGTQSELL